MRRNEYVMDIEPTFNPVQEMVGIQEVEDERERGKRGKISGRVKFILLME